MSDLLFVFAGLGTILLEILVIPGFGIIGICGFGLLMYGLYLLLLPDIPVGEEIVGQAMDGFFIGLVGSVIGLVLLARLMIKTKFWKQLTSPEVQNKTDGFSNSFGWESYKGMEEFADDVERKKNIVESEKRQVENKKARVLSERQKAQKLLNQANQQLEKLDKEHADLEKLEDAIQADIDRLMSVGGVAPGKLSWPITGSYVSSGYKWRRLGGTTSFHGAIDIPSSTGTPIKAAAGGVVIVARYYGAAGRTVFIDHGGGMTTLYFHMNRIYVSVGQTVVTGDVIGSVGTTGRTTGPHLHFEVRLKNPSSVNCSRPYLDPTSRGRMNPYCFLDG